MQKSFGALLAPCSLALVGLLFASPVEAGKGCIDACTEPTPGGGCLSLNFGCNPFTNVCERCVNDGWCVPGGTCQPDGSCAGVMCAMDGGSLDAGDGSTGTGTTADGGSDGGGMDAGDGSTTGTVADSGTIDTGVVADAGGLDAAPMLPVDSGIAPVDPNRDRTTSTEEKEMYQEECRCTSTRVDGGGFGLPLALLALGWWTRRRRR